MSIDGQHRLSRNRESSRLPKAFASILPSSLVCARVNLEKLMNTSAKYLTMILTVATLACLPVSAASTEDLAAQESRQSNPDRFDLQFDGGTLEEFVLLLRQQDPAFNIIIQDNAMSFPLPPMQLKDVSIKSCIWMIDREHVDRHGMRRVVWSEEYPSVDQDLIVIGVRSVVAQTRTARTAAGRQQLNQELQMRVFFVGNLRSHGYSSEMILGNITRLRELQGSTDNQLQAVIGDQSDVLMVRARNRDLIVIEELLDAMDQSRRHRQAIIPTALAMEEDLAVSDFDLSSLGILTEDQIGSMTDHEIRHRLMEVSMARKLTRNDLELRDQLIDQFKMLMSEMKRRR